MARKYIDCRDYPSDKNCTLELAADDERELLEAAVAHGVLIHGHKDSPEFREHCADCSKYVRGIEGEKYRQLAQ